MFDAEHYKANYGDADYWSSPARIGTAFENAVSERPHLQSLSRAEHDRHLARRETPIYWRFPCGAGRPAIFGDASR
jgi:hypothetical protein